MRIGLVVFNGFTDLDFFLPWDLLNRVRLLGLADPWQVEILGDQPSYTSAAGLEISTTLPYAVASECLGVFFSSGSKVRELILDSAFLSQFRLNPERQAIAAIDSGALILGALGLLKGVRATTYPTAFQTLESFGAKLESKSFVEDGGIATAARCLSGDQLSLWMIRKLAGDETAVKVFDSVRPLQTPQCSTE